MIRVYTGSAPDIFSEVFPLNPKLSNDLRNQQKRLPFPIRPIHSTNYGSNLLNHIGLKLWQMVPNDVKNRETGKAFKFRY